MSQITGHISQIIGPVIDVFFDTEGKDAEKVLPKIHDALKIDRGDGRDLIVEVQQHIGEDTVRCVAMDNTDGLHRGLEAIPMGSPIVMPAGDQIKGRMLNVIGQPIDGMKQLNMEGAYPIHREAPTFEELSTKKEILSTGIKVIDLLEPYMKGGKIGLFGGELLEGRSLTVNGIGALHVELFHTIDRLTDNVQHTTFNLISGRHLDR